MTTQQPELDLSVLLRDRGMDRVTTNERLLWRARYFEELQAFLDEQGDAGVFLPEDFQRWFLARGNNKRPHHPNIWGAMWMTVVRRQLVEKTGVYRQMSTAASHGRATAEYRRTRAEHRRAA
jgi:hypothetical protein